MKKRAVILAIAAWANVASLAHAGGISEVFIKAPQSPPVNVNTGNVIATAGESITVVIQGSGVCSGLKLDKGDGSEPLLLQGNFPLSASYAYQGPGKMTVKAAAADGTPDCSGSSSASVYVAAKNAFKPGTLIWGGNGGGGVNVGLPLEKLVAQVGGSGHCDMVQVDFGDGSPVISAGKIGFDPGYSSNWQPGVHAFRQAGTYAMKVWDTGSTNCGTVTAEAHVKGATPPPPVLQISPPILMAPVVPKGPAGGDPKKIGPAAPVKPKCPQGKPGLACSTAD